MNRRLAEGLDYCSLACVNAGGMTLAGQRGH